MKRFIYIALAALLAAACSEKDDSWDAYDNWPARNAAWYEQVADSARTAIRKAQQEWGTEWAQHCDWRMYQSTTHIPGQTGPVTDSICLRYLHRAPTDGKQAQWNDTVRVNYRGFLMTTQDRVNGQLVDVAKVFDQTFYGTYNPATACPQQLTVSGTVAGFATALQYMRQGDEVMLYIPQQLAYGSKSQSSVPAYSTLRFHLALMQVLHVGEKVTAWK